MEDPPPPANTVSTSTVNANAAILSCSRVVQDITISGTIEVDTASDNDFIGFAWGMQDGDGSFYLVSWKQAEQTPNGANPCSSGLWPGGLLVKRVDGASWADLTEADLICDEDTANSTLLLSPTDTAVGGWADNTPYGIEFVYTPTGSTINIDDPNTGVTPDWSVDINDSTYPAGRFGTFDMSQIDVVNGPWSGSCNQ